MTVGAKRLKPWMTIVYWIIASLTLLIGILLTIGPIIIMASSKLLNMFFIILAIVGIALIFLFVLSLLSFFIDNTVIHKTFFLSTLIVTVLLLISSTVFLASNTVLSGAIETLKFESECDGAQSGTSVCKALNMAKGFMLICGIVGFILGILYILQVVIVLLLVQFRRAITISLFGGSIALVAFGVLTFVYAVYMMAVTFHGFVVIAFLALLVGIAIIGFGIVGIIGSYDLAKVNRILLFVIGCIYFISGVTMLVIAIMGLVMNEATNYAIVSQSCDNVCGIDVSAQYYNQITGKNVSVTTQQTRLLGMNAEGDETTIVSDYPQSCCEYLNLKLQTSSQSNADGKCVIVAKRDYIVGLYIRVTRGLIFPVCGVLFWLSFFVAFLGICAWIIMKYGKEWRRQDLQELMVKRGGMLTQEDLKRLGSQKQGNLEYQPKRGGGTIYVYPHMKESSDAMNEMPSSTQQTAPEVDINVISESNRREDEQEPTVQEV
ncbi:MAG: hypothetical protein EZS28_022460 [Streblomastix strix]|uniref:Uncharacterized protein n=1 Tax=Streblomastix strix TaxID=222440 RepID=A0A5J4VHT6_9EUKA|nr:MAG: hypothetical protein EZS28_022460 [Streblomastix strix]